MKELRISTEDFPPLFPERKALVEIKYLRKINQKFDVLGTLSVVFSVEKSFKSKV